MKTRVISTDIWDQDKVFSLNIDTKLLYLVLLTNPYISQTRFYKINDRQLSTFSGLNVEQIQKCKRDLEESKMVYFRDGWVCVTGYGFVDSFYKGSKNEVVRKREIDSIPSDILSYFSSKLDSLSIPYTYPIDTTINNKSYIINNKSILQETKFPFSMFWDLYPKKVDKKKAEYKWNKLDIKIQELIIADLPKRILGEKWAKDGGRFIEMPTTYLNSERWNDEILLPKETSRSYKV